MSVVANSSLVESSPTGGQSSALLKLKERMNSFVQELERTRAEVNQRNAKIEEETQKKSAVITLIYLLLWFQYFLYNRICLHRPRLSWLLSVVACS